MARPVIALLTDFGLRDHYAGSMKGSILDVCPEATLVDITHDVPPHDVMAGAMELAAAYRYFPAGTIFLAVVDPGVGSQRRGLAVEAGGYRFVAPDNGLLSLVLDETNPQHVVELTERRYARSTVSRTFEGRDRFGPAAAWLARGVAVADLGRTVASIERLSLPQARMTERAIDGEILRVDRFGNLITNIERRLVDELSAAGDVTVLVGKGQRARFVVTYSDVSPGELCALIGSTGQLEIAANGVNAAALLGIARGAAVRVVRSA
jgi:S-adenosylmethionine hydrolase